MILLLQHEIIYFFLNRIKKKIFFNSYQNKVTINKLYELKSTTKTKML